MRMRVSTGRDGEAEEHARCQLPACAIGFVGTVRPLDTSEALVGMAEVAREPVGRWERVALGEDARMRRA